MAKGKRKFWVGIVWSVGLAAAFALISASTLSRTSVAILAIVGAIAFSVLAYEYDPELVTIIAVAHSKRKPGYWRDRV
jgi:hypothetical protein